MIRSATLMLGAGLLAAGMSVPLAAQAHAEDNALAFVIGAAAAHALHDDDRKHVRHPHRPNVVHVHGGKHRGWYNDRHWKAKYWKHKNWQHKHWKAKRWDRYDHRWDRHDRRWDRHDRRWDRHDRKHDRHDRRHDRKDRDRDRRRGWDD